MPKLPEETVTMNMRGRPVTHDEAGASAQRLINSHFHNADGARVSIPARPDNDDILVMDYILEQRQAASIQADLLKSLKATVEIVAEELESIVDCHTLKGDRSTLDEAAREDVERFEAVLSDARAAIAAAEVTE